MNFKSWGDAEKRVEIQKKQIHGRNKLLRDREKEIERLHAEVGRLNKDASVNGKHLGDALLQLSDTRKILAELGRRASAIETKSDKLDLLAWMQGVMEGAGKPLYDPASDPALKRIDAEIKAIKDMSTIEKPVGDVTVVGEGVDEHRYCNKCGKRVLLGEAAHPYTCTGPTPIIEKRICDHRSGTLNPRSGAFKCGDCGETVTE